MIGWRAQFAVENIDLEEASGIDGAFWEPFQLVLLSDENKLTHWRKSRQVAFSFTVATEAIIDAVNGERGSLFVSINLDEAKEKIRYARAIYGATKLSGLPSLVRDNETSLEFSNGMRVESLPGKAPRGRGNRNVYLDEFAHVQHDKQIYTGALPVISKGGRLRMGSSTMGASGVFWEIDTESLQPYPDYVRHVVPWWEVKAFTNDLDAARVGAPLLSTKDRVDRYGNEIIQLIYSNMPEEDFQQEYEAIYVDESTAWITWEEIKRNQDESLYCEMSRDKGSINNALSAIERLAQAVMTGKAEGMLCAGVDIGRTRNTTELFIGGRSPAGSYPLRACITLDNVEFEDQFAVLARAMERLPIITMLIDKNGIGMNLAEDMWKKFTAAKARGVQFTNDTKRVWATDAKMLVQKNKTPLPHDRDLAYQLHSVKKLVTASKNLVFDTEKNEKHHADKFWAWALMLNALHTEQAPRKVSTATSAYTY